MKVNFREIQLADAEMIGKWRTTPRVTEFLNSDFEFSLENQENWIRNSRNRADYYHWVIESDGKPVGHIQLSGINIVDQSAEWGYFIGDEEALQQGIGGHIPALLYAYCFKVLGLRTMKSQCLHTNTRVIALHLAYGYHFEPKMDHPVFKGKKEFLSIGLTLSEESYYSSRFSKFECYFPTQLWQANPFGSNLSSEG